MYEPGEASVPAVEQLLRDRDTFLIEIRERLEQAQQHYKSVYDRAHREVEFAPGQWVWLRLFHRPMLSLLGSQKGKLAPKFFGPFQVLQKIGEVAYRLQLPAGAKLHDVFHVGLLKPYHGDPPTAVASLPPMHHGRVCPVPSSVLRTRLSRGKLQVLVQWKDCSAADTSWVDMDDFKKMFPEF
uniref:Chromo domain-containing protein n=1 Tax=Arundo donax TaxID=35708 RepID=A0A0A9G1A7_ARUDO